MAATSIIRAPLCRAVHIRVQFPRGHAGFRLRSDATQGSPGSALVVSFRHGTAQPGGGCSPRDVRSAPRPPEEGLLQGGGLVPRDEDVVRGTALRMGPRPLLPRGAPL